jgi:MFS family permease
MSLFHAFRSLKEPVFRWWFLSQIFSASGSTTQMVAQAWLVLKLTGKGVDLGLLSSCALLPVLVGGPWAGALVDRVDRRRLLIVTQSLFVGLASLLAVLTATGAIRLWMLFVLAAISGTVNAPDAAARQVYVVELVGRDRLASAVSLYEVVLNASRVLGPAAAGVLLATVGVAPCFEFNAVSFLAPLVVLLVYRTVSPTYKGLEAPGRRGEFRAGLRYVWNFRAIRTCLFLAAASGMLFGLGVTLPLLTTRVFHLGSGGYGLMMAAFGLGALPGALLAASTRRHPTGRSVAFLAAATGVCVLMTASAVGVDLEIVGLVLTGCMSIWFIARANTLVQMEIDPRMRGRVMGIWNMALPGTSLVTAPMVGWVIDTVGPREGFGLAGVALFVTAVLGWRSLVRPVEAPAATGQGASPGADLVGEWPTAGGSSGQP